MKQKDPAKQVDSMTRALGQLLPRLLILVLIFLSLRALIAAGGSFLAEVYNFRAKEVINILRTRRDYEAEPATFRAIRFNPQSGFAHYFLGAFYHRQGRLMEAERELEASLRTMTHPSLSLMLLARIMIFKGDKDREGDLATQALAHYDRGRQLYEQAFRMNPLPRLSPGEEWYWYGYCCLHSGFFGRAVFAWRRAIEFGYTKGFGLKQLVRVYIKLRQFFMALYELKSLGLADGYNSYILQDILNIHKLTGSYDEGLTFFMELQNSGKLPAEIGFAPAVFHYLKGNSQQAINYLQDFISQNPENKNAYLLLGEIYYKLKDKDGLVQIYKTLMDRWPNSTESKRFQGYLKDAEQW